MANTSTTTDPRAPRRRQRAIAVIAAMLVSTAAASTLAVPVAGAAPAAPAAAVSTRAADPAALLASSALFAYAADDLSSYARLRNQLATVIATRLGLDPEEMSVAWASADMRHQRALLTALTQLGVSYRRNALRPGIAFDCSGLTTYAWSSVGVSIPRSSGRQIRAAAPRDASTAQAGDLVHYPGHVMMWLGVGRAIVHASDHSRPVEVRVIKRSSLRFGDPTG
jgi:cell wall-associated NlpC family hydrolase